MPEPIAITGMAVNTPLADDCAKFLDALLAGRSAITAWKSLPTEAIYSKIGGDLGAYDHEKKREALGGDEAHRLKRLGGKLPWSTKLAALVAIDAWRDARVTEHNAALFIAGHNFLNRYQFDNVVQFIEEPDYIASAYGLHSLDSHQASAVAHVLGIEGPIATVGAACASGNLALRQALHELRAGEVEVALVVGGPMDYSTLDLHALGMLGAISMTSFNATPERASRPFDTKREGFIPAHGAAALVLERLSRAKARGAKVHAQLLAVAAGSDANAELEPSEDGQIRVMRRALAQAGITPDAVDYVNAHATSTPAGDLSEARALTAVFGRPKVNATKSMLGHAVWSSALVETVATILQMRAGMLHPCINIDELDPAIDLDLCRRAEPRKVQLAMKTAFGFGGVNSASILAAGDR